MATKRLVETTRRVKADPWGEEFHELIYIAVLACGHEMAVTSAELRRGT